MPFLAATRRWRPGLWAMLCLLPPLFLGGCSTWTSSSFQAPDVQLVYARLLEQEFMLEFRIDNPNSHSLPVRGVNYEIQLDGVPLGRGQNSQWLSVPAGGHAYLKVPVHTNLWRHLKNLVKVLENPTRPVPYALRAEVKTGLMFNKSVPVSRQGSFTPGEYLNR